MEAGMGKFKVGDKVRCKESYGGQFTEGKIHTVKDTYADGFRLLVERDDNGSTENGWSSDRFELANDNSPIRTVTRREIVPGEYLDGGLEIFDDGSVIVRDWTATTLLRAAARIFNEIADVLDEQSAEAKGEAA